MAKQMMFADLEDHPVALIEHPEKGQRAFCSFVFWSQARWPAVLASNTYD